MPQYQRATIFADDDVTVLAEFSTDPAHVHPWLKPFNKIGEPSIDFVNGTASIGQASCRIIDKRTIANDQDSGYLTALIAANKGLLGNRMLLEQQRVGAATYYTVFNGLITEHPLNDTLTSYTFGLRDLHERVRTSRLFSKLRGMTILPIGVETGYGLNEGTGQYLIPPTAPLRGQFWRDPKKPTLAGRIKLQLTINQSAIGFEFYQVMQNLFGKARQMYDQTNGRLLGTFYPGVTVKWRAYPGGGAWTTFEGAAMPFVAGTDYSMANIFSLDAKFFDLAEKLSFLDKLGEMNLLINLTKPVAQALPTHEQQVEVYVLANGEPSEALPQYIDENFGDLLDHAVSGYYDQFAMGVTINPGALAVMKDRTKRARTIITEPIEGEGAPKKWIEENIYKPNGYAPQLNDLAEVVPIKWELPDINAPILEINDQMVREDARWTMPDTDVVNIIAFETYNEYLREAKNGYDLPFRRFLVQKQTDVDANITSIAKLGLKEVSYKQTTVRSLIGLNELAAGAGDNSLGARLRAERKAQVRDRFPRGSQRIIAYCRRSATGIAMAQEGDWCQVSISWLPELGTGRRGTNRLMQIVKIREDSQAFRGFELLDSGEFGAPVAQPLVTGSSQDDVAGTIAVTVANIPAFAYARLDYAVSAAQPAVDSGLWQFGGRTDTAGDLVIGPFDSRATIWWRVRGEKPGTRRSAWTNPASRQLGYRIGAFGVRVEIDAVGVPTVFFQTTFGTDAVRVYYDVHPSNPDFVGPLANFVDVLPAAGATGVVLPVVVSADDDIAVQVTPFRLGVAGTLSDVVISGSPFDSSSGVPTLEVSLVGGNTQSVIYKVDAATPGGIGVVIYYSFGDDPFVLTVANHGQIVVPRATNDSGDRFLHIKSVGDNGLIDTKDITVDFDTNPELSVIAEAIPIYTGNVQTGWRLRGTVDDDTRAIVISITPGLAIGPVNPAGQLVAGSYWSDTRTQKTWSVDLTQSPGERGTVTITPREFYDPLAGGMGGQPFTLTLERPGITLSSVREMSATQRDVTLTANPATASINYRINGGAWSIATGKTTFSVDVSAADVIVEFYSATTLGTVEEVKRLVIDRDSQPGITSLNVTESTPNNAHVVAGFDDDVTHWRFWARRQAWPTLPQSVIDPATWIPDDAYLRYDGGMHRTSIDFRVGGIDIDWFWILRAYDDVGNFVQQYTNLHVSGAPPAVGSLSNVHVQHNVEGGLNYNDLIWDHNQTVQDVSHTVTIRESDNGAAYVQLVAARDARLEHDGGAAVALLGGYHTQKPWVAPGTPGAIFHTYNYQIDLRKSSDNSLVASYSASMSAWEAPGGGGGAPPATIPNTLAAFGEQLQARGTWVSPDHVSLIRLVWQRWNGAAWIDYASYNLAADTVTHTQTGLSAGDEFRFKVIYYNSYGDSTAGYATSGQVTILSAGGPPEETPSDLAIFALGGQAARAGWNNTSNAYGVRVSFFRDSEPFGTDDYPPGTTQADRVGYGPSHFGSVSVAYFNDLGEGPTAGPTGEIPIT